MLPMLSLCVAALAGAREPAPARYVFLFIGDGMGAAQVALAEAWKASVTGDSTGFAPTSFTGFPVRGEVTTHCAVRRITESAAAATALASGTKAGDAVIGLDPRDSHALRTLAEEARDAGVPVGIMTTVAVNHATPAGFYAHVDHREMYWEIGSQLSASRMDLFAGAGFLDPTGKPGQGLPDLHDMAKAKGYRIVRGRDSLASARLPALLLAPTQASGISLPWAMDPPETDVPRLADYVRTGIRLLDGEKGFFLMVEGGKVDWACHANDARAEIGEVWDLDSAVQVALEFAKRHPKETLILVTADHETGGLTLGNGENGFRTDFSLLSHQKLSAERLSDSLGAWLSRELLGNRLASSASRSDVDQGVSSRDSARIFKGLLVRIGEWTGLGRDAGLQLRQGDTLELALAFRNSLPQQRRGLNCAPLARTAIGILDRRAGVGWTTASHTALPVPVYAWGAGAERFAGRQDNTDLPRKIRALTDWGAMPR